MAVSDLAICITFSNALHCPVSTKCRQNGITSALYCGARNTYMMISVCVVLYLHDVPVCRKPA